MNSAREALEQILGERIIAIVRLRSGEELLKVASALKTGGINCIEYTVTTPNALDSLRQAAAELGEDVLVGVGTVLDPETARAAIMAGAEFVVSPTLNLDVIELCHRYGKLVMPGCMTPNEILTAWETGADLIKVFPASALGPRYIKSVLAPLPQVRLVPTGGVSADNAADYLKAGAAAVAVGGNLVSDAVVQRREWDAVTGEAHRLVKAVRKANHI